MIWMWISAVSTQTDSSFPCKECDNKDVLLSKKSNEMENVVNEVDSVTARHKEILLNVKDLETELNMKNETLNKTKDELAVTKVKLVTLEDELKENTGSTPCCNDSLTLKRLRKIHSDLEKENHKMEENHKKELEALT